MVFDHRWGVIQPKPIPYCNFVKPFYFARFLETKINIEFNINLSFQLELMYLYVKLHHCNIFFEGWTLISGAMSPKNERENPC